MAGGYPYNKNKNLISESVLPNSRGLPVGHPPLDLHMVQMSLLPRMHGRQHFSRRHALKRDGMITAGGRVMSANDRHDT